MSSKIKVDTIENVAGSGNVSLGSGHNLVVPGNNSTTGNATVGGTLGVTGATTLTGDLAVDTDTLKVDSTNNRVGINTTTGPESLNIGGGGNLRFQTTDTVRIEYLNTSGAYALGTTGGASIGFNRPATGDDEIFFETHNGGVSHAERMRINKDGYITMPYQPSFQVKASPSVDGNGKIHSFGTIISNVGSHWNNGQGKFTAPAAGVYLFYACIWPSSGMDANNTYLTFQKNGTEFFGGHTTTNRDSITIIGNIPLAVNDYVNIDIQGGWTIQGSDPRNNFGGHLIG